MLEGDVASEVLNRSAPPTEQRARAAVREVLPRRCMMQLCLADQCLLADSPAKPVLRHVQDLMRKGIDEGRAALQGLRSVTLPEGSLEKALYRFVEDL